MKVEKKILAKLEKCYSLALLKYQGKEHLLAAAEKVERCLMFDMNGKLEDTIWREPGGAMGMLQVPGTDGQFLAIHKFYSPNDSKDAKLVIVTPRERGDWEIRTLAELPHIHRFDILEREGIHYLIACTIKSGHAYKNDWSMPGKVYAAILPDDISGFDEEHQLELEVIMEGMTKNHGYYRIMDNNIQTALISAECGVFQLFPPERQKKKWEIKKMIGEPVSDAVLVDLDEDGEKELVAISPFHGDEISIYKKDGCEMKKVYTYDGLARFSHAIFGGQMEKKPVIIIGHRRGERNLLLIKWNPAIKQYESRIIDCGCGSANVLVCHYKGKEILFSANREANELAMYTVEEI